MEKMLNKIVAVLFIVSSMSVVACSDCEHEPYDDSEIKAQITDLYQKLAALESTMNSNVETIQEMIAGRIVITEHSQDDEGNWVITLSDGTSFVVYAGYEQENLPSTLVNIMEQQGELVWATIGAGGELVPITDKDGNVIPVVQKCITPELESKIEDGVVYFRIAGTSKWSEAGVSSGAIVDYIPENEIPTLETKVEAGIIYVRIVGTEEWVRTGIAAEAIEDFLPESSEYKAPELETKVEEGIIYIRIVGTDEWLETGVASDAIEDMIPGSSTPSTPVCNIAAVDFTYELNKYGDYEPVMAIFTLTDGSKFTVALDGTFGFGFSYWGESVESLYVEAGTTMNNVVLWQNQLIDFIKEVPMGWNIEFSEPDLYGDIELVITAPTVEAIESGAAVASGNLKLIGVFEGNKSAVAKIALTTEAFNSVEVANGNVLIVPNVGVEYFVYGILPASEYSAETLKNTLNETYLPNGLWSGWAAPYHAVSSYQIIEKSAVAVYGKELTPGEEYVVWAALLEEKQEGWDYVYYLNSDFVTDTFSEIVVEAEATEVTFNNIKVAINFLGFNRYYGSIRESQYFDAESELSMINNAFKMGFENSLTTYLNDSPTIETSLLNFPCADISNIDFGTTYTFWVIPVEDGKTEYSESDMYVFEFTSTDLQAGATVKVTESSECEATLTSLAVTLKPDVGAASVYYQFYKKSELPADSELAMTLLNNGYTIFSESMVSAYDLESDTEYVLAAIAVDSDGKYGDICKFEHKTVGVTFSDTFTLSVLQQTIVAPFDAATKGMFKFETTGGEVSRYYYYNLTADEIANWESDEAIAKELVLNTTYSRKQFYPHNADVNGCFTITNLKTGVEYTLYVLATDGTNYTKMQKVTYTPELNATIIPATDERWSASKPTVNISSVVASGYSYSVAYTVTPATSTKVDGGHFNNIYTNDKSSEELLTYIMTTTSSAFHYISAVETEQTYNKTFNITSAAIWVTWTDAEGNYYEPMKVVVEVPSE